MEKWTTPFKSSRTAGAAALIAIVLITSGIVLLYKIQAEPFQDYDEATYAEIVSENLASTNHFNFTFLSHDYFRKPPLLFWITDVSKALIPSPEIADRLPSVISGILLIALIILITYTASGSLAGAAFGGAVLLTTSAFMEPARQVRFDILVSLLDVFAVYTFWKALIGNKRWYLVFGACIGLSILTKGPLVIYGIVPVLAISGVYKNFTWLKNTYFWMGVLISLGIVVPWHLYETIQFGATFWQTYLGDQVINRVGQTLFTTQPTNFTYLEYAFAFTAPWLAIFCASCIASIFLWRRMSLQVRAFFAASVAGVLAVFLVDFVTKTKAFSYLIPLYPFMALAIALVVYEAARRMRSTTRPTFIALLCVLTGAGFGLTIFNAFHLDPYYGAQETLAREEKSIGVLLKNAHAPTFYVYDTTTVGSIMFYSGLIAPIDISVSPTPVTGSYLLYQTGEYSKLVALHPEYKLYTVYQGPDLTLAQLQTP